MKPKLGIVSFTGCQGCQFTILFINDIMKYLNKFDVQYFHLMREKNRETNFDIVFVEGAITSKREVEKLKRIRAKTKFLVALGACATHGGIPAMRNFLENKELLTHVYNQKMLKDSIEAAPVSDFVEVDYFMYGCPIIKEEFIALTNAFLKKKEIKECETSVCMECPKRGKDCYLNKKTICLGAVTHGGCKALCLKDNHPCILCRGPIKNANFGVEIELFSKFGYSEDQIKSKIAKFYPKEHVKWHKRVLKRLKKDEKNNS
ncbi:NADH:ubiquinone oxidoreductase [archaeon]|jgi:sulfhydrogenase subunit delta|nr:NADH:ubiquinone oxidoreductase [archaeon]MBT4397088.1 NADH:ubiquinone oxidoreductase [archaeon]MBT4441185.1 NADH:ubiquinone oxidoreductase [archaeon]